MGMTMTQKILAAHAGLAGSEGRPAHPTPSWIWCWATTSPLPLPSGSLTRKASPGSLTRARSPWSWTTSPPTRTSRPPSSACSAAPLPTASTSTISIDVGQMGVEHALLPEKGLVAAGDCIIGADSHTCTYGALGAFSTGVGSTDMAAGMATGETWFKVPEAIKVHLTGTLPPMVSGKDVILHLIGLIGVDGALYQILELLRRGRGRLVHGRPPVHRQHGHRGRGQERHLPRG